MESSREGLDSGGPPRRLARTLTASALSDIMDPEVVPSSLAVIAPILRVANEVEEKNPRVAYLCRFYAFDKAHRLDTSSAGRGVRQFKTALLHKLEKDDEITLQQRKAKSDPREMQNFYQDYYDKYVKSLESNTGAMDRAHLARTYQTASVLFDVLKAVNQTGLDPQMEAAAKEVEAKKDIYVAFNILPLDPTSASEAIMTVPEVKAAVTALRNLRGLPGLSEAGAMRQTGMDMDLFDWLQNMFGFQKDNVANQREHLILLLANIHVRQVPKPDPLTKMSDAALSAVMKKLFKNYKRWCKFLNRADHLRLPKIQQEIQQRKILYIGLYLLIWGEAANLRFMPECLCYIFHHMAGELSGMLAGNVSSLTGENVKPTYGGGPEAFLEKVVTPIYDVIAAEVDHEKFRHSQWRNYDDLNEYFWSSDCFRLGWPMRDGGDFFKKPSEKRTIFKRKTGGTGQSFWVGKTNFVEVRSFLHIFRSFDRLWSFFVMSLQALIIIAWNGSGSGSIANAFSGTVFEKVLSIFITAALLRLMQAIVDIGLIFKAWRSMKYANIFRYVLKVLVAIAWVIILPICYAHSWGDSTGLVSTFKDWLGQSRSPSLYVTAILVYLAPDVVSAFLFLFPMLRRALEQSDSGIVQLLLWWDQPPIYVGRGMHESPFVLFKYTLFWVLLLTSKFLFSYYLEINPLVKPTKALMAAHKTEKWLKIFPTGKDNLGVIIAIWAPIVLVYFMDTQIWFAIWLTIFGGINGAVSRLGEVRTLEMLKSRFRSLSGACNANLVSATNEDLALSRHHRGFSFRKSYRPLDELYREHDQSAEILLDEENQPQETDIVRKIFDAHIEVEKFSQLWNAVIKTIRDEDYINNTELNLLLIPKLSNPNISYIQWPAFLLVNKIASVIDIVKDFSDQMNDEELSRRIGRDPYMNYAIVECYDLLMTILRAIVKGYHECSVVERVLGEIQQSIVQRDILKSFRMSALPLLLIKIRELVRILEKPDVAHTKQMTFLLQDILEVYERDMKREKENESEHFEASQGGHADHELFGRNFIEYPPASDTLKQMINRLHLLLATEESTVDVPSNLEAKRRITFFANSLFMEMPRPPKIREMIPFSVLTPYYGEDILYTKANLLLENEDGVTILFYLQNIYPDDWKNFVERMNVPASEAQSIMEKEEMASEVCKWASYRAQTLTRTARGMMYYRKAIKLQAFFDMAEQKDIMRGHTEVLQPAAEEKKQPPLLASIEAVTDIKFTFVVTCQNFAIHRRTGDPRANDILRLMEEYPAMRVAYIEEVDRKDKKREFYSVLMKAVKDSDAGQVIYRIKLPGKPILGEGKAENQNHAIIFTRGEALQAIDMNQDYYLEEAFKMRNLLQEFIEQDGIGSPSILGVREHIFTGSVSSVAGFMSNQESSFVTIVQRVLANPLKVRFHYGHADVFDRLFHLSRGGISKASCTINLSEDIFAGFNTTLRRGNITHHEYIQVGKGRDMGLNQISRFEAKIANGNGEQTISRDVYRLGHRVDFFRMLSVYFTTIGFYFNSLLVVLIVYVFLYGRIYLALSGLEGTLNAAGLQQNIPLQIAMASQSIVQIGFLIAVPMVMEIGLERGFRTALSEFVIMQLQLAAVFFTFSMGTKVHYYGRTLLHGGAKYRPTGRVFVVFHAKFTENYRLYSRSHFTKGLELLILLIVYDVYGARGRKGAAYIMITFLLWFLVGTWLFAPFLFNPSGFEWQKIVDDWEDWKKWVTNRGGIGVSDEKSWESWWEEEQAHLKNSGLRGQAIEILLSLRFLLYQYGLVYHLQITQHSRNVSVYILSWIVILVVLGILKAVSIGKDQFSTGNQLLFRLVKIVLFFIALAVLIAFFAAGHLALADLFVGALAFLPSGWALVQIAQACQGVVRRIGMWDSVKALARGYEFLMGVLLFAPVALLAWFPFISDFQTRILFNQAFSRGLQISRILSGRKDKKMN